ncbi:NAD-dependent epimerase/dehydratase family protein [Ewingella sp. S1.OA.A_B6]
MSDKYTVIGGNGFIGGEIVSLLKEKGETVNVPVRNCNTLLTTDLGIVIFAAGNGDCVNKPFEVFNSNTKLLADILEHASFTKLIYISSTRVYMEQEASSESANVTICESDNRRLFNLTKLVSEELCLRSEKNTVIVRPSNVYGLALHSPLFLPSIIRNSINNKHVDMYVSPEYAKDYVSVTDVAALIYKIAQKNTHNVYNIASGSNTTADEIANVILSETQCSIKWHNGFAGEYFPVTDNSRTINEYNFSYRNVLDEMKIMIKNYIKYLSNDI